MNRRLAFYAPIKPPDHPVPSGDRRMARALIVALDRAGWTVEVASRLRSWDGRGDLCHQHRIASLGARIADRLARRYAALPPAARPAAWLTYHAYHKSPDWLGPVLAPQLGIPYVLVEPSFAPKQAGGPWAFGHGASEHAIGIADVVLAMTEVDAAGLAPLVAPPAQLRRLPPFLDPGPFQEAAAGRAGHRAALAARLGLDPAPPWLLTVAMMRADVKLDSYRLLATALARLLDRPWRLLIAGEGPARGEVEAAMAALGPGRVAFAGAVSEGDLRACCAACDLFVWPALREAYGLAMLEAAAAGLPVVAGRDGGVAEVVRDGVTGVLVPPRDATAFAAAITDLLERPDDRARLGRAAAAFVAGERSLDHAAAVLDDALLAAARIRKARSCSTCS
jgi:glycosyltransferase involved in cell wall biosynthesis